MKTIHYSKRPLFYFKEDALVYFKTNVPSNIKNYNQPDFSWVQQDFQDDYGSSPFLEFHLDTNDFDLKTDENNMNIDAENAAVFYDHLKGISDSQASDERLWAGLCHSTFHEYVYERWNTTREKNKMQKKSVITGRYFAGPIMWKFRNTLSRLWWVGRLTYDKDNPSDPYHLTKVLGHQDFATRISDLFSPSYSRSFNVIKALLEVIDSFEQQGVKIESAYFRSIVQYINLLGGVYLLDTMEFNELKDKIRTQMYNFFQNGPSVSFHNTDTPQIYLNDLVKVCRIKDHTILPLIKVTKDNLSKFLSRKVHDYVILNGDTCEIVGFYKHK